MMLGFRRHGPKTAWFGQTLAGMMAARKATTILSPNNTARMRAIKVQTLVQRDGELHLDGLPLRKGNRVEAILLTEDPAEDEQPEALQRFLSRARASTFKSPGPYPSRDELHERR